MRALKRLWRRIVPDKRPLPEPAPAALRGNFDGSSASAGRVRTP